MAFGGSPSFPATPPPPPTLQQPNINQAGIRQQQAAKGAQGNSSTIKTGGDLGPANTAQKTLLGS